MCFMKTGEGALVQKRLVGCTKRSLPNQEEDGGVEDLLFEPEDFLPEGQVQKASATKRGEKVVLSVRGLALS